METYVLPDKIISRQVIKDLSTAGDKNMMDVFQALRKKDRSFYSLIFGSIKKEEVFSLMGALAAHLRLMLILKGCDQYDEVKNIASQVKKNPFYLGNLWKDIRSWKFVEIFDFLKEIHQLDYNIKAGRVDPVTGLQLVVSRCFV